MSTTSFASTMFTCPSPNSAWICRGCRRRKRQRACVQIGWQRLHAGNVGRQRERAWLPQVHAAIAGYLRKCMHADGCHLDCTGSVSTLLHSLPLAGLLSLQQQPRMQGLHCSLQQHVVLQQTAATLN